MSYHIISYYVIACYITLSPAISCHVQSARCAGLAPSEVWAPSLEAHPAAAAPPQAAPPQAAPPQAAAAPSEQHHHCSTTGAAPPQSAAQSFLSPAAMSGLAKDSLKCTSAYDDRALC